MRKKKEAPTSPLRLLRENCGLSRLELSKRSGIGYVPLASLEHQKDTRIETACAAAAYFDVSVDSLFAAGKEVTLKNMGTTGEEIRRWLNRERAEEDCITGVEYHRRKQRLSQKELSQRAGVSKATIHNLESRGIGRMSKSSQICRIAGVLNVRVDDLFPWHKRNELAAGDRGSARAESVNPHNLLDNYRVRNNLTYREMAARLGLSCQGAIDVCRRKEVKQKYIQRLSDYEGISTNTFELKYMFGKE